MKIKKMFLKEIIKNYNKNCIMFLNIMKHYFKIINLFYYRIKVINNK